MREQERYLNKAEKTDARGFPENRRKRCTENRNREGEEYEFCQL